MIYFTSDNINLPHAFSTRTGGVSGQAHLYSLNLGETRGDDPENVAENYDIFLGAIGLERRDLVIARQIASANVRAVTEDDRGRIFTDCDGFVTNRPGVVIGVKTADCTPILLADEVAGVIGAAHAGWRGAVNGIAKVCVEKMAELGASPENIMAAVGPAIRPCCYEVGADFCEKVREIAGDEFCKRYVTPRDNDQKYSGDIVGMNIEYLKLAGLPDENISVSDRCTCHEPELFFSHRYSGGMRGAMCSVISLKHEN